MAETATSSRFRSQQRPNRSTAPTTAPAPTASTTPSLPPSITPFLSPRRSSPPHRSRAPQTPSPNYFGFQAEGSSFLSDSPQHAKQNWSSPSSAVRSTAAASPRIVPLEQDPAFDAFRRHSQEAAFNLADLNSFKMNVTGKKQSNDRSDPRKSSLRRNPSSPRSTNSVPRDVDISTPHRATLDTSAAEFSRSPKRVLSPGSATESNRRGSPPTYEEPRSHTTSHKSQSMEPPSRHDDQQQRFQLPLDTLNGPSKTWKQRAETLPASCDMDVPTMVTPQHVINLLDSKPDEILLLDLRVSTQYSLSHVRGALNLCIPTTLLKRPSFNVAKLADTFKNDEQRAKFENWRHSRYIVVYDANSTLLKDAAVCSNAINKFHAEGYAGTVYIIRGGFVAFVNAFPSHVDHGTGSPTVTTNGHGPEVAPVIGGCPLPSTDKPANPFFGNIRQNMDLIGGVGQMAITRPSRETRFAESEYPAWLKSAVSEQDEGKKVSVMFEQIERREKKRMEDALSGNVSWDPPSSSPGRCSEVQIAGLEKGSKNRYNNIWPFEHSRVRLEGVPSYGCDYFNASHIKASWSNKRYISTQAPIPATFDDFWNVVWQQDVRVIVMLTAEKEGPQVKAHNYWDRKQYGPLHLGFLSEKRASLQLSRIQRHQKRPGTMKRSSTSSQNPQAPLAPAENNEDKGPSDQPYVLVRKFTLSHDKFPFEPMREITQLQYSSWPDFGAPAHPAHLLGLVEQCGAVVRATNSKRRASEPEPAETRPILVHCSAGCGRTGTFCTVDSVIDMLKRQRLSHDRGERYVSPMKVDQQRDNSTAGGGGFFSKMPVGGGTSDVEGKWVRRDDQDLVEKTVEDFRHQRLSMVQTLRQYVLCYESVMEWLVQQWQLSQDDEGKRS